MTTQALLGRGGVALGSIRCRAPLLEAAPPPHPQLGSHRRRGGRAAPGDELLEEADGVATRAITIDAPASAVWPWIAQMGPSPRGGAYTYDWIENLLGLDMHSADQVLPEYQHPQVGDTLGYGKNRMRFERVEPRPRARDAFRGRQLGLELCARRARRRDAADQPQPLPASLTGREDRNDSDGAGVARHGAEDAPRHQAARGMARRKREGPRRAPLGRPVRDGGYVQPFVQAPSQIVDIDEPAAFRRSVLRVPEPLL